MKQKIFEVYKEDGNGEYKYLIGLVEAIDFIDAKLKMMKIYNQSTKYPVDEIYIASMWGSREIIQEEIDRRLKPLREQIQLLTHIFS